MFEKVGISDHNLFFWSQGLGGLADFPLLGRVNDTLQSDLVLSNCSSKPDSDGGGEDGL